MSTGALLRQLGSGGTWKRIVFLVIALPAICRAAIRLFLLRDQPLDALATKIRNVPTFRSKILHRPREFATAVSDLLRFTQHGRRKGRCWWRSLLLLDLLARCDEAPRLHVGIAQLGEARQLHAWVSGRHLREKAPRGFAVIWSV